MLGNDEENINEEDEEYDKADSDMKEAPEPEQKEEQAYQHQPKKSKVKGMTEVKAASEILILGLSLSTPNIINHFFNLFTPKIIL